MGFFSCCSLETVCTYLGTENISEQVGDTYLRQGSFQTQLDNGLRAEQAAFGFILDQKVALLLIDETRSSYGCAPNQ